MSANILQSANQNFLFLQHLCTNIVAYQAKTFIFKPSHGVFSLLDMRETLFSVL